MIMETAAATMTTSSHAELTIVREILVCFGSDHDLADARRRTRLVAEQLGFTPTNVAMIVAAASELLQNTVKFAGKGKASIREVSGSNGRGIQITVSDNGPGIPDVNQAMREGFSTTRSLGLGLPGCRKIMDDFEIESTVGKGTIIRMAKWIRGRGSSGPGT